MKNSSTRLNFSFALASLRALAFLRCCCRYNFWFLFFLLMPGMYFLVVERDRAADSLSGPFLLVIIMVWQCHR